MLYNSFLITRIRVTFSFVALFLLFSVGSVFAQDALSGVELRNVKTVSVACLDGWEGQDCLKAVSASNYIMVSNYGAMLKENNQEASAETLKQTCAASTAAMERDVPAYAMKSAFVECANSIVDVAERSKLIPDQNQYQILVGAVLCLSNDERCQSINEGLKKF